MKLALKFCYLSIANKPSASLVPNILQNCLDCIEHTYILVCQKQSYLLPFWMIFQSSQGRIFNVLISQKSSNKGKDRKLISCSITNIYNYPQNTVLISFVRPGKSFRYNTDKEWRTHV